MQLVQSTNVSGLYSTRVLLAGTTLRLVPKAVHSPDASGLYLTRILLEGINCGTYAATCAVSERLSYSIRVLLMGTNWTTYAPACAASEHRAPLLDPRAFGAHYLCRQCCSWCNFHTPRDFTRPVLLTRTNCATDTAADAAVTRLMMFKVQQPHDS